MSTKNHLFNIAVDALRKAGWKVSSTGNGKSSVRRIVKGGVTKLVSIRTTQDTWIAFPRREEDKGWRTLDDVDQVVAVSVDDRHNPKFAKVHILDGDEMRGPLQSRICGRPEGWPYNSNRSRRLGVVVSS